MFSIDKDMTISVTRGDVAIIPVPAVDSAFEIGDIIRIKVFEKKNCANVIFQKDFGVAERTESFELILTQNETKIGEIINKPITYWYEIELNPDTNPNTIVGYDEDGPKLFVLYPEGEDIEYIPPTEDEIGPIDYELSLTSKRPIANCVVAKKTIELNNKINESAQKEAAVRNADIANEKAERVDAIATEKNDRKAEIAVERERINQLIALPEGSTVLDAEVADTRVGHDGFAYPSAGDSVRNQTGEINYILNNEFNMVNLYNNATNTENIAISISGEINTNTQYATTDYIRMTKGKYWVTCNDTDFFSYYAIYNKSKNFIKRYNGDFAVDNILTIEDDCYIRAIGNKKNVGRIMLVKGTTAPPKYIPYGVNLDGKKIYDNTINKEKTDFIKSSTNLINHNTVKKGYSINANGVIVENTSYSITDKIHLKPSTNYTFVNVQRICYFDEDDNFISMNEPVEYLPTNVTTIKTPIGISYAIVLINNVIGEYQLNEGDELLEYEKHYILIDGYKISDGDEVEDTKDFITKIQNWDKTVFDKAPLFTLTNDLSGYSADNGDINVLKVLDEYNALTTANPDYITKTELGADVEGNMLYRYDFVEPEQPHSNTGHSQKKPKVILLSGVHPEFGGIWCLYNTMNEITNNPELIDLKRNVHFIVVPIVNYYGCLNYIRTNANGVDLARNFEVGFIASDDTDSNTYSGTAPLTELECQYIDTLLSQNTDAICFASCHSFQSGGESGNDAIWGASATLYETNLTMKVIDKLSRVWKIKYNCIPNNVRYMGSASLDAPNGSESKQAMKYGIQGLTLEIGDYFKYQSETDRWSSMAISRGTEVYINWLLVNLYNYENGDKNLV